MDRETFVQMSNRITKFLIDNGQMVAMKDKPDEKILKAERRLKNKLTKLQAGVAAEFIKALREKGYLPGRKADQRKLIDQILSGPFSSMRDAIADEGVDAAELGRQIAIEELAAEGLEVTLTKFDETARNKLRDKLYTFSEDTFDRITGDFSKTLTTAYENGDGIDGTVERLRSDFKGLRDHRLESIARTEIQGAQNEGAEETMREYNVDYKQWITVGDERVRGSDPNDEYDHVHLHGQVVKVDEPFTNGLMYPTDRDGDIGDWIGCRCRTRPYIPKKDENITSTPYYP